MILYFTKYANDLHNITVVESSIDMIPGTNFHWSILVDPLSVIMCFILALIAFLIHVYAWDYMGDSEPEVTRFYAFLNFFTGSMFGFVLSGNLFQSFIFWELLGVSSYFLIGHYWRKSSATFGATKAFLYNKIGDVAFMLGIFIIFANPTNVEKSLDYTYLSSIGIPAQEFILPGLLIFGAAIGKSAQLPLSGWLAEAMEGPTPVSALLHSSTMVKAGLFLLMRNFFSFFKIENLEAILPIGAFNVATVILWCATLTALFGALLALTSTDFKKILAFSTISQLGYIGMAIGAGGLPASFYHLLAHATFKSLLFLCAGAVIHNIQNIKDIRNMGGLWEYMRPTAIATLIGLIALAGLPFIASGFYSKDAVLLTIMESHIPGAIFAYAIGLLTAMITALYATRLFLEIFFGKNTDGSKKKFAENVHPHSTSLLMKSVILILAGLVVIESVYWAVTTFVVGDYIFSEHWLGTVLGVHGHSFNWFNGLLSATVAVIGVGIGLLLYNFSPKLRISIRTIGAPIEKAIANRFGIDIAIYWISDKIFVNGIAKLLSMIDMDIIDNLIIKKVATDGILKAAEVSDAVDQKVIDGAVNSSWKSTRAFAILVRPLQNGFTGSYARYMTLGLIFSFCAFTIVQALQIFGIIKLF